MAIVDDPQRPTPWITGRTVGVLLLSLASLPIPKLALPAAFMTFLVHVAQPHLEARARRWLRALVIASALVAGVSMVRFLALEGVPGIIAGGQRATARTAISRLREVLFAQDVMRREGRIDPDGDRIGSAALLGELLGEHPVRGRALMEPPLVARRRFGPGLMTPQGPAFVGPGYLFQICLPAAGGGWTARPGQGVDDEEAERRWVAYAWPATASFRQPEVYFIDEHERILTFPNIDPKTPSEPRFAGPNFPPPCDIAWTEADAWAPWRKKKPRQTLPGDTAAPAASAAK